MCDASDELFDYELFGLTLRSDLAIPELQHSGQSGACDVRILKGTSAAGTRITVDGIADYVVSDGREIWVAAHPDASPRNVRLYLLGSAMGLLLHQRGLLPLHANCVEIGGVAVAFMGSSGSGKSTLAAWFHDRGHAVVADDVSVIRFNAGDVPVVDPGLPRLRLWKQALEASGRNASDYLRSYAGDDDWDKFDVPLDPPQVAGGPQPLAAIYLLDTAEESQIARMGGLEAADALFANTYRGHLVSGAGEPRLHWEACVRLVRSTPIFRARRRWGLDLLDAEAGRLLAHSQSITGASAGAAR